MSELRLDDLHVSVGEKSILNGASLTVRSGEIHAIMGPNGSGKSTLAAVIMGHPDYRITSGSLKFDDADLSTLSPDARARLGLFLAFQNPSTLAGVSVSSFLRAAHNSSRPDIKPLGVLPFQRLLNETVKRLAFNPKLLERPVNEGFSGGEQKQLEVLQLAVLKPRIAILDEVDSGLDIDSLQTVAAAVLSLVGPELGLVVITHYPRILKTIRPDVVHIMSKGRIVRSGDADLAAELEKTGYAGIEART